MPSAKPSVISGIAGWLALLAVPPAVYFFGVISDIDEQAALFAAMLAQGLKYDMWSTPSSVWRA